MSSNENVNQTTTTITGGSLDKKNDIKISGAPPTSSLTDVIKPNKESTADESSKEKKDQTDTGANLPNQDPEKSNKKARAPAQGMIDLLNKTNDETMKEAVKTTKDEWTNRTSINKLGKVLTAGHDTLKQGEDVVLKFKDTLANAKRRSKISPEEPAQAQKEENNNNNTPRNP